MSDFGGRVQVPPRVQELPSRLVNGVSLISLVDGSMRAVMRNQVVSAGGPTMVPPKESPPA